MARHRVLVVFFSCSGHTEKAPQQIATTLGAAPLRSWFAAHAGALKRVAFLVTSGGKGVDGAVGDMALFAGRKPEATVALSDSDRASGVDSGKIDAFVDASIAHVLPDA